LSAPDVLQAVSEQLKDSVAIQHSTGVAHIRLFYHSSEDWIDPFLPIVDLSNSLAVAGISTPATAQGTLRFFALNDDDAFERTTDIMAPLFYGFPRLSAHRPRILTVHVDEPDKQMVVLQMSGQSPKGTRLHLLYWPRTHDALILTHEQDRRARSYTTESMIDLLLAHTSLFGLHGSAVSYGNRGVIFTGGAGAGKTSLTLSAVRKGAEFISDDISIVSQHGWIFPLEHKEMTLRIPTVDYLQHHGFLADLQGQRDILHRTGEIYRRLVDIFPSATQRAYAKLVAVVFPMYRSDCLTPDVVRLSAPEATHALLQKTEILPWIMQWEDAFRLRGKMNDIKNSLTSWIYDARMSVLRLEYGNDLDHAEERLRAEVGNLPHGDLR
jgi:hypothetical protein